jgi:uncharacterized protein YcfL
MPAPAISAPAPSPVPSQQQTVADPRFVLAPELERSLHVVSVGLTQGAFLKIQVNVQNKTDVPVRFRYRIEWFDKDGALLPLAGEKFMPWMLLPRETSLIAATALASSAVDFEIAFVPDTK